MIINDNINFLKDIKYKQNFDISHIFKYDSLNDNGYGQSEYIFNLTRQMKCDMLIIGGGGGGGTSYNSTSTVPGAGGGAGGLIFLENQLIDAGTYIVKVGKGGNGDNIDSPIERGLSGSNSYFSYLQTEAIGGGGGGSRDGENWGVNGGSGGGSVVGGNSGTDQANGGFGTITDIVKSDGTIIINNYKQGSNGGDAMPYANDAGIIDEAPYISGGGGAYEDGKSNRIDDPMVLDGDIDTNGGNGKYDSIGNGTGKNFKTLFNIIDSTIGHHNDGKIYFAGGGSGGYRPAVPNSSSTTDVRNSENNHSFGGLGGGASSNDGNGNNGLPNTGGGGSGSRSHKNYTESGTRYNGGNGGSGIVILRFYNDEYISLNTLINMIVDEKNLIITPQNY
jgi:hypothetical protein